MGHHKNKYCCDSSSSSSSSCSSSSSSSSCSSVANYECKDFCKKKRKRGCPPPKCPRPNFCTDLAAKLSTDREVQEVSNSCAWGYGNIKLDKTGKCVKYCFVIDSLSGDIVSAGLYQGPPCETGPLVKDIVFKKYEYDYKGYDGDFCSKCMWVACGCWGYCDDVQKLTGKLIDDLVFGGLYINVLTAANPSGEVRGQLLLYGNQIKFVKYGDKKHH